MQSKTMALTRIFPCLLLAWLSSPAESGFTLSVKLDSFYSSYNCDGVLFPDCEFYFDICIANLYTTLPEKSNANCDFRHVVTQHGSFDKEEHITFTSPLLLGIVNPISVDVHGKRYQGLKLQILVKEADDINNDDDVDILRHSYTKERSLTSDPQADPIPITGIKASHGASMSVYINVQCLPGFYGQDCMKTCVPHDSDKYGHYTCDPETGNEVCSTGWTTGVSTDTVCTTPSNGCAVRPCKHGICDSHGHGDFSCGCDGTGYTGDLCETDVDECISAPCRNEGTCINAINQYVCQCADNFVGQNCEFHLCKAQSPCRNGGTCYEGSSGDVGCFCTGDFQGEFCTELCKCRPHGSCKKDGTCDCDEGFKGSLCDVDVCSHKNCMHGGRCEDGICLCKSGWSGDICDDNQAGGGSCASNPCLNGGECWQQNNKYKCECPEGIKGTHCETSFLERQEAAQKEGNNVGMIVGIVAGVFVLIALILILIALLLRERRKRKRNQSTSTDYINPGMNPQLNPTYDAQVTNFHMAQTQTDVGRPRAASTQVVLSPGVLSSSAHPAMAEHNQNVRNGHANGFVNRSMTVEETNYRSTHASKPPPPPPADDTVAGGLSDPVYDNMGDQAPPLPRKMTMH